MHCKNCGNKLSDNDKFCDKCGKATLSESAISESVADASEKVSNNKKNVDHAKRIRDWAIFYIILAVLNIGLFMFIASASKSSIFLFLAIPAVIMGLLAFAMLRYKNKLTAGIFFAYYMLIFLINMSVSSSTGNSNAGSILFIIGLIGIFQCLSSASKLAKSK